jgi:hypothetical protein
MDPPQKLSQNKNQRIQKKYKKLQLQRELQRGLTERPSLQKPIRLQNLLIRRYLVLQEGIVSFIREKESEKNQSDGWKRRSKSVRDKKRV